MLDRWIVNTLYGVPGRVAQFQKAHPEARVLVADGVKARRLPAAQQAQYELGWATARRSTLILTDQALHCGDWTIPLATVQEAALLHISGGSLLQVTTEEGEQYQFGMQRNPQWEQQTALPLTVRQTALQFSVFSILIRLLALAWLGYLLVSHILQDRFALVDVVYLLAFLWFAYPLLRWVTNPKRG